LHPLPEPMESAKHKIRGRLALFVIPMLFVDMLSLPSVAALVVISAAFATVLGIACTGSCARSRVLMYVSMVIMGARVYVIAITESSPVVVFFAVPIAMALQALTLGQVSAFGIAVLQMPQVVFNLTRVLWEGLPWPLIPSSSTAFAVNMAILMVILLHGLLWYGNGAVVPLPSFTNVLPATVSGGAAAADRPAATVAVDVLPVPGDFATRGEYYDALRTARARAEARRLLRLRAEARVAQVAERAAAKQDTLTVEMLCRHIWARPGPEQIKVEPAMLVGEFLGPACAQRLSSVLEESGGAGERSPWLSESSGRSVSRARRRLFRCFAGSVREAFRPRGEGHGVGLGARA